MGRDDDIGISESGQVAIRVIDPEATEALFGNATVSTHLYRILHGTLQNDHKHLMQSSKAMQLETSKAAIHRIKGALRYCKAPLYEYYLLALEEDMVAHRALDQAIHDLDHAYKQLYDVLNAMFEV